MARIARRDILYDGCYAHIISRSIRKMKLLRDKDDFQTFYDLLAQSKIQFGHQIFHYCLMQTHFHLVVRLPDIEGFSRAIQHVKSRYCLYFHKKYHLSGPIWRQRYRGILIENEYYLRACGSYIENNPVKAGLVKSVNDWPFSSFRCHNNSGIDMLIDSGAIQESSHEPLELDIEEEEFFEKEKVIGSAFYRFQFYEKIRRSRPVPKWGLSP